MCLIAWRAAPDSPWPLLLAANRDELHDRATEPLHRWTAWPARGDAAAGAGAGAGADTGAGAGADTGAAPVLQAGTGSAGTILLGGRDLVAGGTWLGVRVSPALVRLAMLTNVRDGRAAPVPADAPSRGLLVTDVLAATTPAAVALQALAARTELPRMAGFNLIAIDFHRAHGAPMIATSYLAHGGPGRAAAPVLSIGGGIHGLSNGHLDDPWPKTLALKQALARSGALLDEGGKAARQRAEAELLAGLADRAPAALSALPDTGIDPDREQWLSSAFIVDARYGTRCSTVLTVDRDGHVDFLERRYDRAGSALGDRREVTQSL